MKKSPTTGNLKRTNGEWKIEEDTFPTEEPDVTIPKEGWAVVSGTSAMASNIYCNGKPVKNVRSMDYTITAGNIPVLKLEIIAPEIKMVSKGLGGLKGK